MPPKRGKRNEAPLDEVATSGDAKAERQVFVTMDAEAEKDGGSARSNTWKASSISRSRGANKRSTDAAVSLPSPTSYLDRLPPELLHIICDELEEKDISALRLQSKYLCEIVTAHFLRSVNIRFKRTSFQSLLEISRHPILSRNVKTINYHPQMLEDRSMSAWDRSIEVRDWRIRMPSPPSDTASEPARDLYTRTLLKAVGRKRMLYPPEKLHSAWSVYQKNLQEQDDMIVQDYASQDLRQAIRRLPNLTALHVNCTSSLEPGTPTVNPSSDSLCCPIDYNYDQIYWGTEGLLSLLRVLSETDLYLLSLRIESLHWRFFEECESEFFEVMKKVMRSLQNVDLYITTSLDIDDDLGDLDEVYECREYLQNGIFSRLIATASDLRRLAIGFYGQAMVSPLQFEFVVPVTHWPRLHTVVLEGIEAHEGGWMAFFSRHASTLRFMSLSDIRILEGEWTDILERMQRMLTLDDAYFGHWLRGDDPEQAWLTPLEYIKDEGDSLQQDITRAALGNFMVHGGTCPLRDEVAHPQIPYLTESELED